MGLGLYFLVVCIAVVDCYPCTMYVRVALQLFVKLHQMLLRALLMLRVSSKVWIIASSNATI